MTRTIINKYIGTYEDLASEYYDIVRHPTCANFLEGSKIIFSKFLEDFTVKNRRLCEVGAGRSIVAELLSDKNASPNQFLITDLSFRMLAHSKQWNSHGASLLVADATNLPFTSESFEIVMSSLGDPYNSRLFWREIFRILRPGGIFIFTTPSYEWAISFRHENPGNAFILAEFKLANGKHIWVPSWIYSINDQLKISKEEGFFPREVINVPLSSIKSENISPKLLVKSSADTNVVTGYILSKA